MDIQTTGSNYQPQTVVLPKEASTSFTEHTQTAAGVDDSKQLSNSPSEPEYKLAKVNISDKQLKEFSLPAQYLDYFSELNLDLRDALGIMISDCTYASLFALVQIVGNPEMANQCGWYKVDEDDIRSLKDVSQKHELTKALYPQLFMALAHHSIRIKGIGNTLIKDLKYDEFVAAMEDHISRMLNKAKLKRNNNVVKEKKSNRPRNKIVQQYSTSFTYRQKDDGNMYDKFEYGRNFANKIWNASRFVLMNLDGVDGKEIDRGKLTIADKWILDKLNSTSKLVNDNIKNYRIGETAHVLYDFFWNSYCDWYVEIAKIQLRDEDIKLNTQRVLRYVLDMSLRLLHPIMPHITENIWQGVNSIVDTGFSALIIAEYPTYKEDLAFPKEAKEMELVFDTITSLRNLRQSFNIPTSREVNVEVRATADEKPIFEAIESYIHRLAKVDEITYANESDALPPKSATAVVSGSKLIVPLADLINLEEEIARQNKKMGKLTAEKNSLEGRMKNEKFVANAPKELIEQTTARIAELTEQENIIKDLIKSLAE